MLWDLIEIFQDGVGFLFLLIVGVSDHCYYSEHWWSAKQLTSFLKNVCFYETEVLKWW